MTARGLEQEGREEKIQAQGADPKPIMLIMSSSAALARSLCVCGELLFRFYGG
jgi:hypothetical protein